MAETGMAYLYTKGTAYLFSIHSQYFFPGGFVVIRWLPFGEI